MMANKIPLNKLSKTLISLGLLTVATTVTAGSMGPTNVYNWTGGYIGGNLGGARANTEFRWDVVSSGGFPVVAAGISNAANGDQSHTGVVGGIQLGYNYEFSKIGTSAAGAHPVVGIVADISFGNVGTTRDLTYSPSLAFSNGQIHEHANLDWLGTIRGNVGLAFGPVQVYGTGGVALANIGTTNELCFSGIFCNTSKTDTDSSGGVFGFGVDYRVIPNAVVGVTALWANISEHLQHADAVTPGGVIIPTTRLAHHTNLDVAIVTARASYFFDTTAPDLG